MNTKNVPLCYNERAAIVEALRFIDDEIENMEDLHGKTNVQRNGEYRRLRNISRWLGELVKKFTTQ